MEALLTLMRALSIWLSTLSPVMVQIRSPLEMVSPTSQLKPATLPDASAVMTLLAPTLMDAWP